MADDPAKGVQTNTEAPGAGEAEGASANKSVLAGANDGSTSDADVNNEGGSLLAGAKPDEPEGEHKGEGEEDGKKDVGAPEEYAEFSFPEGHEVDAEIVAGFSGLAKELNLTQDQAQKLIDFDVQRNKALDAQAEGFKAEFLKRPDAKTVLASAAKGRDYLCKNNEALKAISDHPHFGNNPAIIEAFATVGKLLSEHKFVESGSKRTRQMTDAEKRFGDMLSR